MTDTVAVDCTMGRSGFVRVKRIKTTDGWFAVEQGRQWQDEDGRHVLIMLPDGQIDEIILSAKTLCWELKARPPFHQIV